jgi:hypothetical protein
VETTIGLPPVKSFPTLEERDHHGKDANDRPKKSRRLILIKIGFIAQPKYAFFFPVPVKTLFPTSSLVQTLYNYRHSKH